MAVSSLIPINVYQVVQAAQADQAAAECSAVDLHAQPHLHPDRFSTLLHPLPNKAAEWVSAAVELCLQ